MVKSKWTVLGAAALMTAACGSSGSLTAMGTDSGEAASHTLKVFCNQQNGDLIYTGTGFQGKNLRVAAGTAISEQGCQINNTDSTNPDIRYLGGFDTGNNDLNILCNRRNGDEIYVGFYGGIAVHQNGCQTLSDPGQGMPQIDVIGKADGGIDAHEIKEFCNPQNGDLVYTGYYGGAAVHENGCAASDPGTSPIKMQYLRSGDGESRAFPLKAFCNEGNGDLVFTGYEAGAAVVPGGCERTGHAGFKYLGGFDNNGQHELEAFCVDNTGSLVYAGYWGDVSVRAGGCSVNGSSFNVSDVAWVDGSGPAEIEPFCNRQNGDLIYGGYNGGAAVRLNGCAVTRQATAFEAATLSGGGLE